MLKNYILIAWKIFLQRKFFTFINLFGISLTLIVLLVVAAIFNGVIAPTGPEKNSNNYLTINKLSLMHSDASRNWNSSPGYKFLVDHLSAIKSAEIISIFAKSTSAIAFKDGNKISTELRRTDANYWKVLDFNFLEGRAYIQEEHDSGQFVAVISELFRDSYFDEINIVGKDIIVNNQRFKVIGVVENVSPLEFNASGHIWVSYTTSPSSSYKQQFRGGWSAILYASTQQQLTEIREEYYDIVKNNFKPDDPKQFDIAVSSADSKFDAIARDIVEHSEEFDSGADKFVVLLFSLTVLFMLLPSINMININVSRIIERSTEIGIRKAFGASSRHLVGQFLVENILLTSIGGVLGFIGAFIILEYITLSGLIPYANFSINISLLIYGILMILLFSFISGIYPAWKMSRLHPVNALKGEA